VNKQGQVQCNRESATRFAMLVSLALGLMMPMLSGQDQPTAQPVSPDLGELIAHGDYEGLDRAYAEALKERPGDFRLTYNRALANYLGGHAENARDILMTVAASDRGVSDYQALLATILIQIGDFKAALEPTQEAARLNPADAENWLRLGALYLRLKRGQHAIDTYENASRRFPDRPEFLIGRGVVEEMLARLPAAAAVYREATTKFPRYEPGYCFLGQVQIKAVMPDEARAAARALWRRPRPESRRAAGYRALRAVAWRRVQADTCEGFIPMRKFQAARGTAIRRGNYRSRVFAARVLPRRPRSRLPGARWI